MCYYHLEGRGLYLYELIRPTIVFYGQISRYTVNSRLSHTFSHLVVYFRHMGSSFNPVVYTHTHLVFLIKMHHMLFQVCVKCVVIFVGVMMPYNDVKQTVTKAPGPKYFDRKFVLFYFLFYHFFIYLLKLWYSS